MDMIELLFSCGLAVLHQERHSLAMVWQAWRCGAAAEEEANRVLESVPVRRCPRRRRSSMAKAEAWHE
jgi:hypothetical protein